MLPLSLWLYRFFFVISRCVKSLSVCKVESFSIFCFLQSVAALAAFATSVDFLLQVNLSPNTTSWAVLNQFSGTPQSELDGVLRIVIPPTPSINLTKSVDQPLAGSRHLMSLAASVPLAFSWTATGRMTPVG